MGILLEGKTAGVIGFGRIGKEVALKFQKNGLNVIYYDPYVKKADIKGISNVSLEKLLKISDVISINMSYDKDAEGFIGEREIGLMKRSVLIINCSRGGIVDENTLYDALKSGRISGAALDVFGREPYNGPLGELDNIVLTPHIGSYAQESRVKMEKEAVINLIKALKGE